ncbi:MAG: hypothetical protein ACK4FK_13185 [Ferrovibrio sp.]|uniref:hypothetical protein n=1 Tax=Ferrovibrio sp. TaxID=1917215 RepID=UPI00391B542F
MRPDKNIKVLVDTSVVRDAITTEIKKEFREIQWGPTTHRYEVEVEHPKEAFSDTEHWRINQILALSETGQLARTGHIIAFTYLGLDFEYWLGRPGLINGTGNLLRDVDMQTVDPAFDPSYLFPIAFNRENLKQAIPNFVDLVIRTPDSFWDAPEIKNQLAAAPEIQQKNFQNRSRLIELSEGLSFEQYKDAFHIWTAEVNGLDYFLTNDRKIINFFHLTSKAEPKAYPISPHMLINIIHQ